MAYPQVPATNGGVNGSDSTSHTINLPASIVAGNLLVVAFSPDSDTVVTWPIGWTQFFDGANGTDVRLVVAYRQADGSEGSTITVTTAAAEQSSHRTFRITGHNNPLVQAPEVSPSATGTSTGPDATTVTPTGGARDYLLLAIEAHDGSPTTDTAPSSYTDLESSTGGADGSSIGVARRELNAVFEDAGAFVISASEQWVAITVAIHPPGPFTATKDTYLDEATPTTPEGSATTIWAGLELIKGDKMRSLLHFDLSSIPYGATINAADIELYIEGHLNSSKAFTIFRVTRIGDDEWEEANATWEEYKNGTGIPWTTAGGDFTATPATKAFTGPSSTGAFTVSDIVDLVQDAIDNRESQLHILIKADDESGADKYNIEFRSKDHSTVTTRPALYIAYTPPVTPPPYPEAVGGSSSDNEASTLAWPHTCTNADSLVVQLATRPAGTTLPRGVKYGSRYLHRIGTAAGGVGQTPLTELWLLMNPPEGTDTITAELSVAAHIVGNSVSIRNVDDWAPFDVSTFFVLAAKATTSADDYSDDSEQLIIAAVALKTDATSAVTTTGTELGSRASFGTDAAAQRIRGILASNPGASGDDIAFSHGSNLDYALMGIAFRAKKQSRPFKVASFKYTGDDGVNQTLDFGFKPKVVFIKGEGTQACVWRTDQMPDGMSFALDDSLTATHLDGQVPGAIIEFTNTGIRIGNDPSVNTNSVVYHVWAADDEGKWLKTGSYDGTGASNAIDVNFEGDYAPHFVIVQRPTKKAVWRSDTFTALKSSYFDDGADLADRITAFATTSGGEFTVTTHADVNESSETYYWLAIHGSFAKTGTYSGTGAEQSITALGFPPAIVLTRGVASTETQWRPVSTATDTPGTLDFASGAIASERIKSRSIEGFTVGTADEANASGVTFHYVAFGAPIAADSGSFAMDGHYGQHFWEPPSAPSGTLAVCHQRNDDDAYLTVSRDLGETWPEEYLIRYDRGGILVGNDIAWVPDDDDVYGTIMTLSGQEGSGVIPFKVNYLSGDDSFDVIRGRRVPDMENVGEDDRTQIILWNSVLSRFICVGDTSGQTKAALVLREFGTDLVQTRVQDHPTTRTLEIPGYGSTAIMLSEADPPVVGVFLANDDDGTTGFRVATGNGSGGFTWQSTPDEEDNLDEADLGGSFDLILAPSGEHDLVYSNAANNKIRFQRRTGTNAWDAPVDIDSADGAVLFFVSGGGDASEAHVVWERDDANKDIYISIRGAGGSWGSPIILDPFSDVNGVLADATASIRAVSIVLIDDDYTKYNVWFSAKAAGIEIRSVAGDQPNATGTLVALQIRTLAGVQPSNTGILTRIEKALRSIVGIQPTATGVLTRIEKAIRILAGVQPAATGTLARILTKLRSVTGSQPSATGTLTRTEKALRSIAGDQPAATGALARIEKAIRSVAGIQPASIGILTRIEKALRALTGVQPAATGIITRTFIQLRSVVGIQPSAAGALTRIEKALRALVGDQPTSVGILTRIEKALRALTGNQPSATGTVIGIQQRSVSGDQPAATGTITRIEKALRSPVGDQPAPTGILVRVKNILRTVIGIHPPASGTLVRIEKALRVLSGNQPLATGTLTREITAFRQITGVQPASSGTLERKEQAFRSLTGIQPFATGALTAELLVLDRSVTGIQPSATGSLRAIPEVSVVITLTLYSGRLTSAQKAATLSIESTSGRMAIIRESRDGR